MGISSKNKQKTSDWSLLGYVSRVRIEQIVPSGSCWRLGFGSVDLDLKRPLRPPSLVETSLTASEAGDERSADSEPTW